MAASSTKEGWLARGQALDADLGAMQEMAEHGLVRGMRCTHIKIGLIEQWYEPGISIRTGDTIAFEIAEIDDALAFSGITINGEALNIKGEQ